MLDPGKFITSWRSRSAGVEVCRHHRIAPLYVLMKNPWPARDDRHWSRVAGVVAALVNRAPMPALPRKTAALHF